MSEVIEETIKDAEGNWDTENEDYQYWGIGCRMSEITAAIRLTIKLTCRIYQKSIS